MILRDKIVLTALGLALIFIIFLVWKGVSNKKRLKDLAMNPEEPQTKLVQNSLS